MQRLILISVMLLGGVPVWAADDPAPAPLPINPAIYGGLFTDGPLTPLMNLRMVTDENGYLRIAFGGAANEKITAWLFQQAARLGPVGAETFGRSILRKAAPMDVMDIP